jgi:hypothetical protein
MGKMTSREYTHTHNHMGLHVEKKGNEEIRNSTDIGSFSNQAGCCLSK